MKKVVLSLLIVANAICCAAQVPIDHFNVGPYVVDYNGIGDIKYRLRDDIDLYEYFEFKKDTTIIAAAPVEEPVENAIQISGRVGANRSVSKEFALEGFWKKHLGGLLHFNAGLSLALGHSKHPDLTRNMLEVGVPVQVELGKLCRQSASLYGLVGVAPTFYTTMEAERVDCATGATRDDVKKSGFLVAPSLEFGGNIPAGVVVLRIGVYGTYKINCTTGDFDVYDQAGRAFFGAKIGVIL